MKVISLLAIVAGLTLAMWMLAAMWLMLAIGDIHRNWWHAVPLMGYDAALPISFTLSMFLYVAVSSWAPSERRNGKR